MRTQVLETLGLRSFPNTPSIPFQVQRTQLWNPPSRSWVLTHSHMQNTLLSTLSPPWSNPLPFLTETNSLLIEFPTSFWPSHNKIFPAPKCESHYICLSLKLSMNNYFISFHCYSLIKPLDLNLWIFLITLLYLDCIASDMYISLWNFSETSDWISSLTHGFCCVVLQAYEQNFLFNLLTYC